MTEELYTMEPEGKKWLMTPVVTLSYPRLFKAELGRNPLPGSQPRRSVDALLTADDLKDPLFLAILAACIACAQAEWGSNAVEMLKRKQLKLPFRDDCAARNYPPEYVRFFTASAVENPNYPPPSIIDISGRLVTDQRLVFPGVRARLMVDPYPRRIETNKGISLGLGNVQIVDTTAKRLAGGVAVDPRTQFPLAAGAPAEDPMSAFTGGNKAMLDGEIPY